MDIYYDVIAVLSICLPVCLSACLSFFSFFFAYPGGGSASIYQQKELLNSTTDDKTVNAYESLVAGLGFASFAYICAFVIFAVAAMYVSPLCCCASVNEWKMAKGPVEIYKVDGLGEDAGLIFSEEELRIAEKADSGIV